MLAPSLPHSLRFSRFIISSVILTIVLLVGTPAEILAQNAAHRPHGRVPGEYIVTYKEGTIDALSSAPTEIVDAFVPGILAISKEARPSRDTIRKTALKRSGFKFLRNAGRFAHVVKLDETAVKQFSIEQNDLIQSIEPNYYVEPDAVPNDTKFPQMWGLSNPNGNDIDADLMWDKYVGTTDVVVGVVDTGIDYNHEDLNGAMWHNSAEIPANGIDDDANGVIDDYYGYSPVNDTVKGTATAGGLEGDPFDRVGHGSHVAGTIAAIGNNAKGVIGVAGPTSHVKLMSIQIMSPTGGSSADAIAGIDYAVMMKQRGVNITVLNNSWGFTVDTAPIPEPTALRDAIIRARNAGIVFVAAAGNGGHDNIGDSNDIVLQYPASHNVDSIISVAAVDSNGALASFSNFGATKVHIAAPGKDIISVRASLGFAPLADPYVSFNGTSMATPHVTGVIALMSSQAPTLTPVQLKTILLTNSKKLTSLNGKVSSGGMLNGLTAFNALPNIPTVTVSGYVKLNGSPLANVSLSAGTYGNRVTNASGFYSFTIPTNAAYSITPSMPGHSFSPASVSGTATANTSKDFASALGNVTLTGILRQTSTSIGIAHATISLGALGSTTSAADGTYSIQVPYGSNYTITPSRPGHTFAPLSASGVATDNNYNVFTATPHAFDITGYVKIANTDTPIVGATVNGGTFGIRTSDATGRYEFRDVPENSSIQLTFSAPGYTFSTLPAYNVTWAFSVPGWGYPTTYQIAGYVMYNGAPLPGVTLTRNGTSNMYTDNSGHYSFSSVQPGTFSIVPSKTGYVFSPPYWSGTLNQNMTAVSFTASLANAPTPTPSPYARLSGRITYAGAGVLGVTVSGSGLTTGTTDANGNYFINSIPKNGTYTITPSRVGYTFTPPSSTLTFSSDQTRDFTANPTLHTLSGTIRIGGVPAAGVTVSAQGIGSVVTGAGGTYSFANIPYGSNWAVRVSKTGVTFTPASPSGTIAGNTVVDFNGATDTFSVFGQVTRSGVGVQYVTMTSAALGTATTTADGVYSFTGKPAGTAYTITPSSPGYVFSPASVSGTLNANATYNFTATANLYTISGTVAAGGTPLSGVTINGGALGTTTTSASGAFSFGNVPFSTSYNLVASKAGYTFSPSSQGGTVNANMVNNFSATAVGYKISGQVLQGSTPVPGVTITSALGTKVTDASGNYSYTNVPNGTVFSITPSLTGYSFGPSSASGTISGADAVRNFTAGLNNYSITITTKLNGAALANVNLAGGSLGNFKTDATGTYVRTLVPHGTNYSITPSLAGMTFTPASMSGTLTGNVTLAFTAAATYKISGTVTKAGVPLNGVTMYAGPLGIAFTNASGYYEFPNVPAGTSYLILPAIDAHEFSPVQSGGTLNANTTLNFTAAASAKTVTLSGKITAGGVPLVNVDVYGGILGHAYTNASGNYTFSGVKFNTPVSLAPRLTGYTFTPSTAFVIANNSWINNFTATISATSVNSQDGNLDSDGDGVTDAQEARDGTNPNDRGSASQTLGNELCAEWNGFLGGMFNILEHTNLSSTPLDVKTTLYAQDGSAQGSYSFSLSAQSEYDVLVHDLNGWKQNSYGRVCSKQSGNSGDLDGRMVYYKPDYSSGSSLDDVKFQFALAMPFLSGIQGSQFVSFNTFPPGLAAGDELKFVANWLQVTNQSATAQSGALFFYDEKGALLGSDEFNVKAGARQDFSAHRFGRYRVGLVELRPAEASAKFQFRNVRYVYDNAGSKDSFDTAFQLEGAVGSGELLSAPVDTRKNSSSVLELANTTDAPANVIVKVYKQDGTLARSFEDAPVSLKAHATNHIILSNFLTNDVGIVTVKSDTAASVIATVMEYGRKSDGSITNMYGIRALEAHGSTLRGSYNTFLKQDSVLWIVNPSDENESASLSMTRPGTQALIDNKTVNIPARGLLVVDLNKYDRANVYGTVTVTASHAHTLNSWVTRAKGDEFVVPTPVR